MDQLTSIPVDKLDWHPAFQVRQHWDPQTDPTLADLTASLRGPEGLIHPVLVVPLVASTTFGRTYTLIAGHRRVAAARRLGWHTILARVLPPGDVGDPPTRLRLLAIALRENTARQDLLPEDRRAALCRLKALYVEVAPHTWPGGGADDAALTSFPRWAAQVTQIPLRTIFQDLRLAALGLPAASASLLPTPDTPVATRVQYATTTGQALTAVLRDFAVTLPADTTLPLDQLLALQQTLHDLQATLATLLAAWHPHGRDPHAAAV